MISRTQARCRAILDEVDEVFVLLKWLLSAISIRHVDTVDVKFIMIDENGGQSQKTIALPHPELYAAVIAQLEQAEGSASKVSAG